MATHGLNYKEPENCDAPSFSSYEDILSYYRKYLLGEIPASATSDGPLERESGTILSHLLNLNSLGILTIDSQPGSCRARVEVYRTTTGKYADCIYKETQRAYLECFMPKELARKIKEKLNMHNLLVYVSEVPDDPDYGSDPSHLAHYHRDHVSDPYGVVCYPVTDIEYGCNGKRKIFHNTVMPINNDGWLMALPYVFCKTPTDVAKTLGSRLAMVQIMDILWKRPTFLFEALISILEAEYATIR